MSESLSIYEELLLGLVNASRGEIKRVAGDLPDNEQTAFELIRCGEANGVVFPEGARHWPIKKLLRHALARGEQARVRRNPIPRDEAFICAKCGEQVAPHGRTARNHCPVCLSSLHVDVVPGDRASTCGGIMLAIGLEKRGADFYIMHHCQRCSHTRSNHALLDGDSPDSMVALRALSARGPV